MIFYFLTYLNIFSLSAAGCKAGEFKNLATGKCKPCPKGTYQPNEGATSCISCPEGSTTIEGDVKNFTSCRSKYICLCKSFLHSLSFDHFIFQPG